MPGWICTLRSTLPAAQPATLTLYVTSSLPVRCRNT